MEDLEEEEEGSWMSLTFIVTSCLFASTQRGKLIPADTTATCESTLLSSAACDERLRAA